MKVVPVYFVCLDCGADLVIDRFQTVSKESMHSPEFLVEMGKKVREEKPFECPKCRYEITLLEQTFYWKD